MALLAGSQNRNMATVRHCEDFILCAHVCLCISKRGQPFLAVYQSPEGVGPIWPSWRVVRITVPPLSVLVCVAYLAPMCIYTFGTGSKCCRGPMGPWEMQDPYGPPDG